MDWKRLLPYITGSVDQELLLRNDYLVPENRVLRNQIKGRAHDLLRVNLYAGGFPERLHRRSYRFARLLLD